MSKVTDLASNQVNGHDTITVELIEADETPAVVIIRWPSKRPGADGDIPTAYRYSRRHALLAVACVEALKEVRCSHHPSHPAPTFSSVTRQ
jgi:hypothetical protein